MEYLINTSDFIDIIPSIKQTVKVLQINHIPLYFLDLAKLEGKTKYDLLAKEVNYLFEIEIPGATDYAPIVSSNKEFLQDLIKKIN